MSRSDPIVDLKMARFLRLIDCVVDETGDIADFMVKEPCVRSLLLLHSLFKGRVVLSLRLDRFDVS